MRIGQVDLTKPEKPGKSAKIAGVKVIFSSTNIYYSAYKFGIIEGEGNMGVSYQYIALSLLCFPDPRGLQKNWCRFERRHSHCDPKQGGGRVSQYNSY